MQIISGTNVDLITPFPLGEAKRVFGWNHCYRTMTENDDAPQTLEEFVPYFQALLHVCPSWAIVDKNHITNSKHEAPLVGIVLYEPASGRHGYFHFAAARKAFKTGLIDEASAIVVGQIFESEPRLLRIGAYMDEKNAPAKGLCRRLGFKFEGVTEDMILRNGVPQNVVYYGLTRRSYEKICQDHNPQMEQTLEVESTLGASQDRTLEANSSQD